MSNIKIIATQDFDDVIATVSKYTEGLRSGSVDGVAQAFHENAVMYGHSNGELVAGPIQALYDVVKAGGAAPEIRTRIDVLEITPTTAAVRVDMEKDASGASYTDLHVLIKVDGVWQVVAKVYHTYEG